MRKTILTWAAALLLTWPAVAQQTPPQPPAVPSPAAPRGPMGGQGPGGGMGMMGGQGPGMGMMGGQVPGAGMGMMGGRSGMRDADDDDDGWPRRGGRRGMRDAPMQIIINIGPNNRVEVEDEEERGYRRGARGMGGRMGPRDEAGPARFADAHLGVLRGALQLRPDQQPAWDRFAAAARDAAGSMMRAHRQAMSQPRSLDERMAIYESALSARLDAIRALRSALGSLTAVLDESQRRTLDDAADGFGPGMRSGLR